MFELWKMSRGVDEIYCQSGKRKRGISLKILNCEKLWKVQLRLVIYCHPSTEEREYRCVFLICICIFESMYFWIEYFGSFELGNIGLVIYCHPSRAEREYRCVFWNLYLYFGKYVFLDSIFWMFWIVQNCGRCNWVGDILPS